MSATAIDADRVHGHLTDERQRLRTRLDHLREQLHLGSWKETSNDVADLGATAVEREAAHAQLDLVRERLQAVEAAFDRLAEGAYGVCASCGRSIGRARLEAVPATDRCIRCT